MTTTDPARIDRLDITLSELLAAEPGSACWRRPGQGYDNCSPAARCRRAWTGWPMAA